MQDNNQFLSSLSSMTPDQTGYDSSKHKKKRMGADSILRAALACVFIAIFLYSSNSVVERFIADKKEQDTLTEVIVESALSPLASTVTPDNLLSLYDSINLVTDNNTVAGSKDNEYDDPARYAKYKAAVTALKAKYPDTYGWIVVTGTNIDYPVLKGDTNDTYIRSDYKGNYANGGSIYVDYRLSDIYNNNLNTVVYGHNMTNGTMFRSLRNWFESANRNSTAETMRIEIYTEDALYIYKPFSGYRSDGTDFTKTSFQSYASFVEYLDMIRSRSIIPCSLPYDSSSKIATLVTCTNSYTNSKERYVLHCLLTQVVKYN